MISTSSAYLNQVLATLNNGFVPLIGLILSAFFGGLFAGLWTNYFESKRRVHDKRYDKYFEHRNSIVQIEHELIPLRVNISRNLEALNNAINNTTNDNIRFILRYYKLSLSPGLNLKLLSISLINDYAQLYSAIESFNSDLEYVSDIVSALREAGSANIDFTLVESYKIFLPHVKEQCESIDVKSMQLLSTCKLAIGAGDKKIKDKYVKTGKEIKYSFRKLSLKSINKRIKKEESAEEHRGEKQPKFVSPFMDFKRAIISTTPLT